MEKYRARTLILYFFFSKPRFYSQYSIAEDKSMCSISMPPSSFRGVSIVIYTSDSRAYQYVDNVPTDSYR